MSNRNLIDEAKTYDADEIIGLPFNTEDLILRLVAALEAQEWRGIDSAPKDGTFCLLRMLSGHITIGQWTNTDNPGWRRDVFSEIRMSPVDWRPLPD